jgi:hypothetical protein
MLYTFVIVLLLFKANASFAFLIRNHGIITTDATGHGFQKIMYYNEKYYSSSNTNNKFVRQKPTVVLSSPPDRDSTSGTDIRPATTSDENNSIPPAAVQNQENKQTLKNQSVSSSYPIDLPSPILLGASVVLAISSIGM